MLHIYIYNLWEVFMISSAIVEQGYYFKFKGSGEKNYNTLNIELNLNDAVNAAEKQYPNGWTVTKIII